LLAGCWFSDLAKRIVTTLEAGRTFKQPIVKLGVSWIAAISKENVTCTDFCTGPWGCGSFSGAVEIRVVSGMIAGVFGCGNSDSVRIVFEKSDAGSVTASAAGDSIAVTVIS
jgi:hypothetical protein